MPDTDKLNVLFIYNDTQEFRGTGSYGGLSTPHMDRFAEQAARFTCFHSSSPLCTPARYNVLTGKYAGRSTTMLNRYPTEDPAFLLWNTNLEPGDWTVGHAFQKAGYTTGYTGKWHLGMPEVEPIDEDADPREPEIDRKVKANDAKICAHVASNFGFDYVDSMCANNPISAHVPKALRIHNQHRITKTSLDFIESNKNKPFFLNMNCSLPHSPSVLDTLRDNVWADHSGFFDPIEGVQPSYASILERVEQVEKGRRNLAARMIWLDDGVGAVLDKLDTLGLAENTLVIIASDHGGRAKSTCYRQYVPCMIRWPGRVAPGTVCDALVSSVDIVPFMFEACGIKGPSDMNGRSFLPLITGGDGEEREHMFTEVNYARGVLSKDWNYIAVRFPREIRERITPENRDQFSWEGLPPETVRYHAARDYPGYFDDDQLYHRPTDPDEQVNLAGDPAHKAKLEEMQALLREYSKALPHAFGEF